MIDPRRILGNRVLLIPLNLDLQQTDSGIFVPDHLKRWNPFFEVVGLGAGCWIRRKGKPDRWVCPEVQLHDRVISTHWQNDKTEAGWHKTEYDQRQDQSAWVLCDARHILAVMER